jgi:hypothetical protein
VTAEPLYVGAPVVLQRWRRYGHDRAYVKRGDADLGYRDLKTGEVRCADDANIDLVAQVTEAMVEGAELERQPEYHPRHAEPALPDPPPPPSPPAGTTSKLPDRDLALNLPGQSARDQALQLRAAAPVRTFVARLVGAKTDERNWRIGADGEEEVARRLARLGPGWCVLHAVPVGDRDSDIDHVVIGPGGVFTINAKHHPHANVWVRGDTVKVNGTNQPYVRNSRHEARRAAKLLSAAAGFDVEVRGVVAVIGAHRGFTVKEQPRDGAVAVVARRELDRYLGGLVPVLGPASIARIYEVARHLSTWQPATVRHTEPPATNP